VGNEYSTAAHWPGDFEEAGLQKWAENLRRQLAAPQVSLGLVFMSPRFFARAKQVLEILRVHARIPLLAGCSSQSLIVGEHEVEQNAGLTVGLYALPGADLQAVHFTQEQVEEADAPGYWRLETGVEPGHTNGWPSLTHFTWIANRGLRPGTKHTLRCPCSAVWPAAMATSRRPRCI
jgi:small ligand-binding sensory domain FIST